MTRKQRARALEVAKLLIKIELDAKDIKVSQVRSEQIDKAAKALLRINPRIREWAEKTPW